MIAQDFAYYRPLTLAEAEQAYQEIQAGHKTPFFYAGGSEIISMARVGAITPGGVVDLKEIPQCRQMELANGALTIGSMMTLASIVEADLYPLLSKCAGRIADHTNQCRITLGGNICGTVIYREAVLPLLLTDASVTIAKQGQCRTEPIQQAFQQRLSLQPGEFLVSCQISEKYLRLPYVHVKKTRTDKIDYPLVTVAATLVDGDIRAAFSGVLPYPFRWTELEAIINDRSLTPELRSDKATELLGDNIMSNMIANRDYRRFVFRNTLAETIRELEV